MWYKEFPNGTWVKSPKVYIPNNPTAPIVLELNHNAKVDGWEWFDEPPQAYLDWWETVLNPF